MKRAWKWIGGTFIVLCVLVALAGFLLFHAVRRNVESRSPGLIAVSLPAPDLAFQTLDGHERHLSDYKGKVVFLDLWGTWCIQCVAEMPTVQALYDRYKNDPEVIFLIVSRLDTPQRVEHYARLGHYSLPFFVTRDEDIPPSMYFHQYPATFLYSKDGRIAAQHAGGADWNDPSVSAFIDGLKSHSK
ncbi:TlpA disulfide reductase family protein [Terriglobus sp. TAA 43]|uniref:TlpA family protein disulfide reductase n=1 Tax=Terriglobus sp. TAA 43 TaxID=278961 RepID=UPI00068A0E71|nr:TlpA disulfide reductase family protein [Terriglobus sp. TAA 43]